MANSTSNPYKVRLDSYTQGRSTTPTQSVIFEVMPVISQTHAVEYQAFDPVHTPASFFVYRGTKAVAFELSCKFVSRTTQEATDNLGYLNILRGWTRGYFGFGTSNTGNQAVRDVFTNSYFTSTGGPITSQTLQPLTKQQLLSTINSNGYGNGVSQATDGLSSGGTSLQQTLNSANASSVTNSLSNSQLTAYAQNYLDNMNQNQLNAQNIVKVQTKSGTETYSQGKEMLGAPPEVVYLNAYSNAMNENGLLNKMTNITEVPCVITSLNYSYTNDVDYIPTIQGQPFPIAMDLSISLVESHSPQELEAFDIYMYRAGALPGF